MKKEITTFTLIVLALFLSGCGNKSEITGEVVNDLVDENQTLTADGIPCTSNTDCPRIPTPVGEPKCISGNNYQTYTYYKCSYRTPKVCQSYSKDLRVGYC